MRWVITQFSAPKTSTDWTMYLKKNPDTCGVAPYLMIILVDLLHTACAFAWSLTNTHKLSSASDMNCPKYLKEVNISREIPYALKNLDLTTLSSFAARRRLFRATPFLHCAVRQCILF